MQLGRLPLCQLSYSRPGADEAAANYSRAECDACRQSLLACGFWPSSNDRKLAGEWMGASPATNNR
jgi:hypothetical protein